MSRALWALKNGVAMRQHRRTMSSQTAASTSVIVTNGFPQMNLQNTYIEKEDVYFTGSRSTDATID
ncbi:hypothetical protein GCM10009000_082450 [Halobacterium noricense]|uniref:Uncharacterized protein n=1 Tax=Haladaptatus pallidirubidus TaxID=1008152 RepID=A0AAV3UQA3_9EURY